MLATSEATRKRIKPSPVSRLDEPVSIVIDSDLMPGLLDQFGASGQDSFETWLSGFVSDSLRGQLGI